MISQIETSSTTNSHRSLKINKKVFENVLSLKSTLTRKFAQLHQSFTRSDTEMVRAERWKMKMMTEVRKKEQWAALELGNSMKQKSYTFKNFVKMNKRVFVTSYLWHLMPHYCIEAQYISAVQEGLDMDKQDHIKAQIIRMRGEYFFLIINSHTIQSIP